MGIIVPVKGSLGRAAARSVYLRSHMAPFETIYIDEMVAACNGGEEPLGHPRVYLNLAPAGKIECPYCSRLFVNRVMAAAGELRGETPPPTQPQSRNV
jgi:uncharacterized Zn-finger protein